MGILKSHKITQNIEIEANFFHNDYCAKEISIKERDAVQTFYEQLYCFGRSEKGALLAPK